MKKAFTLIELLVVIAIIAILAAILFPVFAQAKAAAKKTSDLSNAKQLATAHLIYTNDTDDTAMAYPAAASWTNPPIGPGENGPHWADRLNTYVKSKAIFSNPGNTDPLYPQAGYWKPGANGPTDTDTTRFYRVTSTFNHLLSHADFSPINPGAASMTAVDAPADTVMLGPSQNWYSWSTCIADGNNVSLAWTVSTGMAWGYEIYGAMNDPVNLDKNGGWSGGANFSYVDGHAKFAKLVKGGDLKDGAGPSGLYSGYFPKALNRPNVSTDGTCPDKPSKAF